MGVIISFPQHIAKDRNNGQDLPTSPVTGTGSLLYPFKQLHDLQNETKTDDQIRTTMLNQSLSQPELRSHDRVLQETSSSKTTELGKDRSINDVQLGELTNESTKSSVIYANGQGTNVPADEIQTELDAVKVEFIMKVHGKEFYDICHKNNVEITQEIEPQACKVIVRENSPGQGNVKHAQDQCLELYLGVSAKLCKNNTINVLKDLPDCTVRSLNNALCHANADERVLVKNCLSDDFNVVFYGYEDDVQNAKAHFIKNLEKQENIQDSKENTETQFYGAHKQPESSLDRVYAPVHSNTHFQGTVDDITVNVYKGDITQENVDAVVNAANERLDHAGGVAFAISKAGGRKIQKESNDYVSRHGKLAVGQAMHTGAGKMTCRYIVHTVGPQWNSNVDKETVKAELYEALFNVLHYASSRLSATSIAIPAISAGIYGVPVDVCGEELMSATKKFAQSPPRNNTLRDIRFVNIDDAINGTLVRIFSGNFLSSPTRPPQSENIGDKECPICLNQAERPKRLSCCNKVFCADCIGRAFQEKPVCPTCSYQYGALTGTQPKGGSMDAEELSQSLPGYRDCGSLQITYSIPSGTQEECHPNPGQPYKGTRRMAFLPNNSEGREVLTLLRKAFDNRLVFTVGTSVTTGEMDVVTWNDIHHKTNPDGGASNYGYPDPDYLKRVTEEIAAKGIR